jgi:hypothetical protein
VVDESWFGAFGATGDAPSLGDDSRFTVSWLSDSEAAQARTARAGRSIAETTFERIYGAFIAARAAIGVALIVTLALTGAFGLRPSAAVAALSIAYATIAISMWLLPRFRRGAAPQAFARLSSPQWLATIGADLALFTALHVASPGSSFNYVALLVLPVLMAAC